MDSQGNIHRLTNAEWALKEKEMQEKLAPLSDREARVLEKTPKFIRKGYMRNKPCVCGSGRKFKKCCW